MAISMPHNDTNTLIITNLPLELFDPTLMACLRAHFSSFGQLRLWAPLKNFGRVLAVFTNSFEARKAKALDKSLIQDADSANPEIPCVTIRVYYGNNTPEHLLSNHDSATYLPVPVTDRNFLISPPGSPPIGWEQIKEDPPNTQTLADDLMAALEDLALQQRPDYASSDSDTEADQNEDVSMSQRSTPLLEQKSALDTDTLIIPSPAGSAFPAVLVSDMDPHQSHSSENGISLANYPRGVPRVPSSISSVKATIDSMGGSNSRITPTARPPI